MLQPMLLFVLCFSTDVLLCVKLQCLRGFKLWANPVHPVLRTLLGALGQERGREDVKGSFPPLKLGHWLQGLCTQQNTAENKYPRYGQVPLLVTQCACIALP